MKPTLNFITTVYIIQKIFIWCAEDNYINLQLQYKDYFGYTWSVRVDVVLPELKTGTMKIFYQHDG